MNSIVDMMFLIALHGGRYSNPLSLVPWQAQVYSQNGEDGIVAQIFARLGLRDRYFVEIGIEDGLQSNTRFLLEQGWRGVWVEGSREKAAKARSIFERFVLEGSLHIVDQAATVENINQLLEDVGVPSQYDFLSLDVDQNTSHLWQALKRRSRVACIEYNANVPACLSRQVPYSAEGQWNGTNWYGASLKKLEEISNGKDMSLVGCELAGVNAFFVNSSEAVGKFLAPFIAEQHYEPPRYSMVKNWGHPPPTTAQAWIE